MQSSQSPNEPFGALKMPHLLLVFQTYNAQGKPPGSSPRTKDGTQVDNKA